jgi:diaminopimelate epimerase
VSGTVRGAALASRPFEKYHGLGNDYLVLEDPGGLGLPVSEVRRICHRNLGVGSDGILLRGPTAVGAPFALRILNPDGSEAEKSGNGLRIFARYLFDRGEVAAEPFAVETAGGSVQCHVLDGGVAVRVEMGRVRFDALEERIEVAGEPLVFSAANLGNPHCVVFRDPLREADVLRLGPLLENAPRFPERTNVQLAKVRDRGTLEIEIWERGAGHTLASGSSSCAAAAVAHRLGLCDAAVRVVMRGGELAVEVGDDWQIVQQGPVVHVASGTIDPEALA